MEFFVIQRPSPIPCPFCLLSCSNMILFNALSIYCFSIPGPLSSTIISYIDKFPNFCFPSITVTFIIPFLYVYLTALSTIFLIACFNLILSVYTLSCDMSSIFTISSCPFSIISSSISPIISSMSSLIEIFSYKSLVSPTAILLTSNILFIFSSNTSEAFLILLIYLSLS